MKFIVVDDNKTFREGIKFYLEDVLNYEVIGIAENGEDFLQLENRFSADFILMDIEMPKLNGIETVKKALWIHPYFQFIAVTNYTEKAYLLELISAGFKSCVFKSNIHDELPNAIEAVLNGTLFFPDDINTTKD